MKKSILSLCLSVFSFMFAIAQEPFPNTDEYINDALVRWNIPGLALAVVKDGKIVYEKGYGVREVGKPEKVDENTLFAVASNSKAFTATSLAWLASQGKLSLDDKVRKYIPNFTLYDSVLSGEVTVRDLLCHRMGFRTWEGDFSLWGSKYPTDELIYRTRFIKPTRIFRAQYGYNNRAFVTAGEILHTLTGMTWSEFVKDSILIPLKMTRTTTSVTDLADMDDVATPHTVIDGTVTAIPYRNLDNIAACAGLNSSVHDFAQWIMLHLDTAETLLPYKVLLATETPNELIPAPPFGNKTFPSTHFVGYGLGWFLRDYKGKMVVYHSGGADGMFSLSGFVPEEHLGFVILTNSDMHNFNGALMYQILDSYLGGKETDWKEHYYSSFRKGVVKDSTKWADIEKEKDPTLKPGVPFEDFAGTYSHPLYGDAIITYDDGKLSVKMTGHPNLTGMIEPWQADTLFCQFNDPVMGKAMLYFDVNDKEVKDFRVTINPAFIDPMEYVFVKQ